MKIVSLFSGAGGFDLGLRWAGHRIVWANDIYPDAANTYEANLNHQVDRRPIESIPSVEIPDADVVVGGFPCQGFSMANWARTIGDARNTQYLEMVRVVREKKPMYFVAENVKGLVTLAGGAALNVIESDFQKAGYSTQWKILNSADYGVAQSRQRFIMLGVRKDLTHIKAAFPPKETHSNPATANGSRLLNWITVGEALRHLPEPEECSCIPNHTYSKYKLRFNGHLGHRWVDPNKPAPTVTARGDDRGGVVVLHHPGNHRRMSARELASVQSFPDDFIFKGNQTSVYRQIANAVPPKLGQAIGRCLSSNLRKVRRWSAREGEK